MIRFRHFILISTQNPIAGCRQRVVSESIQNERVLGCRMVPPTTPHRNHKSQHMVGNSISFVAITIVIARFGRARNISCERLILIGRIVWEFAYLRILHCGKAPRYVQAQLANPVTAFTARYVVMCCECGTQR